MITGAIKNPVFWVKCFEFFMCLMCFALTAQYPETELFMFPHNVTEYRKNYFLVNYEFTRYGFVRENILSIATCGFTWIFIPIIMVCFFLEEKELTEGIFCPLLSMFGFFVYLITGALISNNFIGTSDGGAKFAGALSIIIAFVFVGDVAFFFYKRSELMVEGLPA